MAGILTIIETIIEEHKIILADFQKMENVVNDAGALNAIEKSKDIFRPGQLSPREGLQQLKGLRDKVDTGISVHFNREETALLQAFQEYGKTDLMLALKTLLTEHGEIRSELDILEGQIDELLTEKPSRALWESKGYDLRARINQVHKTMAEHATDEQLLLSRVQNEIKKRQQDTAQG
jgi:hypothetical protein